MDRLISEQAVIDVINGCLINRQTVIDKIKAIPSKNTETQGDDRWLLHFGQNMAIPSAEPKWIPVSERLPETNDDVLVTDGVDMFVAWYSRKGMWQGWMSSDNNFERNTPIDAWMPLPSPYKGEQE